MDDTARARGPRGRPLFSGLPRPGQQRIGAASSTGHCRRGPFVVPAGDPGDAAPQGFPPRGRVTADQRDAALHDVPPLPRFVGRPP